MDWNLSKMNEFHHQFRLLMWKHSQLRIHRYFMTGVEIILPIIIAYVLCAYGGRVLSINPVLVPPTIASVTNITQFWNRKEMSYSIAYAPENEFTFNMMNRASKLIENSKTLPLVSEDLVVKFVSEKNSHHPRENRVGVVFLNVQNETKPSSLSYKIRTSNYGHTKLLYLDTDVAGPPIQDSYYITNGLVGVQTALDAAYIQLWNSDFKYQNILFQAFPYPEYKTTSVLRSLVPKFIYFVILLTTLVLSVPLISSIIEEKETGMKELMKMNGIKEWIIQVSWFANAIFFSLISYSIVTYILQKNFNGPDSAVILNVPASAVWIWIILYCAANISFCFAFSAIFHSLRVASSVFILVYYILISVSLQVQDLNSVFLIKLTCFTPIGAFYQGFQRISYLENHQQSLTWLTLTNVEAGSTGVSLMFALLMLILDTFLYLLLSNYITAINPGTFGSRKSPFFFIKQIFPDAKSNFLDDDNLEESEDAKYFEKPPNNLNVSISIRGLRKNFGSVLAVRGVNLDFYAGEITALLGHNGAGKTTTMSILTGMTKPTAGSIMYKNNVDILKEMDRFRQNFGLCPQENRVFPYLSVLNHLLFFGMVKGASKVDALKEAYEYLNLMGMTSKANSLTKSLSGGMRRKLCLSIALMGKVEILILDEPTSGMDVQSRRKVWDLLLEMRGNRTIILTTHHMEEADVLGDRVAIMNRGTIVCHGTTMFLKKVYGTGYEMTITKNKDNEEDLTNVIKTHVPNFEKKDESAHEIVYKLPLTETARFPTLFHVLEEHKNNLGIVNVGVSCTTMEQVFLKVGDVSLLDISRDSLNNTSLTDGDDQSQFFEAKMTGLELVLQQIQALFLKKWLFVRRRLVTLFFRIFLPTLALMFLLHGSALDIQPEPPINLTLSTYSKAKVMLTDVKTDQSHLFNTVVKYVKKHETSVILSDARDIIDGLLDYGRKSLSSFQKELLLAATFNSTHNLTLYNNFAYHSLPVLINSLSNIQLQLISHEYNSINTINHPVDKMKETCSWVVHSVEIVLWFMALAFYSVDLCNYFSIFLSVERIDGFKHIQFMSNVSPFMYWISNFVFDFAFFFLLVFVRIICFRLVGDYNGFVAFNASFVILLLLLIGFIASGLLFTYVLNFFSNSKNNSYSLFMMVNILGVIVVGAFYAVQSFTMGEDISSIYYYIAKYFILFVPSLNYSLAFIKFSMIWFNNFEAQKAECHGLVPIQEYLTFGSKNNPNGVLEELIFMGIDIILYFTILGIIEAGYFNMLTNKFVAMMDVKNVEIRRSCPADSDVMLEKTRVHFHEHQSPRTDVVLIAEDLKKVFIKNISTFVAVNDVNFAVKAGECFGLLGVNGAGKSTSFKMLTAALLPTKGDSLIQNIRLSQSRTQYLSKAGYCAQTNCFIEELTGREMLTLIAKLRGVRVNQVKLIVDKWLSILGIEKYQNLRCGRYSGGNKRKLCTAISLIGDPNVVFLDEPTTGVDPVSRRKLYDVMEQSKSTGQAVVLTSHSMEECENLCNRLTIMTRGEMKCIGSVQHLKKRFAQGFSVAIKTRDVPSGEARIQELKNLVQVAFQPEYCILKDEHKGLLHYHVFDVQLKWSQLFEILENLKLSCDLIEDYTITDTSLEEVFMSLAKQA